MEEGVELLVAGGAKDERGCRQIFDGKSWKGVGGVRVVGCLIGLGI